MKRSELVDELAKEYPHLYHRDIEKVVDVFYSSIACLLYTSPSPRDKRQSRMPSSA